MVGGAALHPEPRPTSSLTVHRADNALSSTGFATIWMRFGHSCCLETHVTRTISSCNVTQRFGIPFLTLSVHSIHLTLSGITRKHTISKLLLIPLATNSSASDSLVINGALQMYFLAYLRTCVISQNLKTPGSNKSPNCHTITVS